MEFCHGAALQKKLDHSGPNELLDVCVLSLEDGWLIRAIFTVGRKVEDCGGFFVFFFFVFIPFLPCLRPSQPSVWGQAVLPVPLRKSMPRGF